MPVFVGYIGEKRVEVEGETLKEAMANGGYMPLNQTKSGMRLVGQLTTGERFYFRISPVSKFNTPREVIRAPMKRYGERRF